MPPKITPTGTCFLHPGMQRGSRVTVAVECRMQVDAGSLAKRVGTGLSHLPSVDLAAWPLMEGGSILSR